MCYFIFGLLVGLLCQKNDYYTVKKIYLDLVSLYKTLYEKQVQNNTSENDIRNIVNIHFSTSIQVVNFISLTFLEKVKKYFKSAPEIIQLSNPNKVLYGFKIHNKTRYIPVSTTKLQVPDIIDMTYEQVDDTVSKEWISKNLCSIISVYPDYKQITPKDIGFKNLSIEILDGADIKTLKFEEDDPIKVM